MSALLRGLGKFENELHELADLAEIQSRLTPDEAHAGAISLLERNKQLAAVRFHSGEGDPVLQTREGARIDGERIGRAIAGFSPDGSISGSTILEDMDGRPLLLIHHATPELFASIFIALDELLDEKEIRPDPADALKACFRFHPSRDGMAVFYWGVPIEDFRDPITHRRVASGIVWELLGEPSAGWYRDSPDRGWRLAGYVFFTALVSLLVYLLARQPQRLRVEVERATAALGESERRLNDILTTLDEVVWSGSPETHRLLYLSPAADILYGIPRDRFFENPRLWFQVIHPEDRESASRYTSMLHESGSVSMTYRIVRPDGTIRWVRDRGSLVRDAAGKAIRLDGIVSDITREVEAGDRLLQSEQRLREIVQRAPIVLLAADRDARFTIAEGLCLGALGLESEAMIGRTIPEIFPHSPEFHSDWRRALSGDSFRTIGSIDGVVLETWLAPSRDARGLVTGAVAVATDITARQYAEESLRENEERFRLFANAANDGVAVSVEGRILDCNDSLARILGRSVQELRGFHVMEFIAPEDRDDVLGRLKESDESVYESRILRPDGKRVPVEVVPRSITLNGQPARITVIRDVTIYREAEAELRRAKETAEQAARTKSEFLANMSHEIRTPLNAVIGVSDLIEQTSLDRKQREYVEIIRNSGDALLTVLNDILDFSKLEAGKLELESISMDPGLVAEDVAQLLAQNAHAKGLEFHLAIDPRIASNLLGDAARLRQVLVNLVSNAIKFTPTGGVTLRLAAVIGAADGNARIAFSVSDTGIGIPEKSLDRLFRPFSQVDSSTTRQFGGTGLGLAICAQIVAAMGSAIQVHSSVGKGTTFHFEADFPASGATLHHPRTAEFQGCRIGIADANPERAQDYALQIAAWGAIPTILSSEDTLLGYLALGPGQKRYDAWLIDDMLAGSNRAGFLATLAHLAEDGMLPAVLLCEFPSAVPESRGRSPKIRKLSKPPRMRALRETLHQLIGGQLYESAGDRPEPPKPVSETAGSATQALPSVRVLLVEDNLVNQRVAVEMLRRLGASYFLASNGAEAVLAAAANDFDLVLMDCQMPVLDGYEATRRIRRLDSHRSRVRIVAMTANALEGDRERCLEAGMDDHLAKPVTLGVLGRALEQAQSDAKMPNDTTQPKPKSELLDLARFSSVTGGDNELRAELAALFIEDGKTRVAKLREAIRDGDIDSLRRAAHTIKGAAGNVGAMRLHHTSALIEVAAQGGDTSPCAALVEQLASELDETILLLAPIASENRA